MSNLALTIVIILGRIAGWLIRFIYGRRISFLLYTFKYSFITALYRGRFKHFGVNSKLISAPDELKSAKNMAVGDNCRLGRKLLLRCYQEGQGSAHIHIGNHVNIGDYSSISCCNYVELQDGVRLGRMVLITDNAHGHTDSKEELNISPIDRPLVSKGSVVIERNVWIGEKVSVMPGVIIGESAIIAANAVVTHSIPPFCVAAGVPAKVIKQIK